MACATSPDVALETLPVLEVDMTAHKCVQVSRNSEFIYVEFHKELNKSNIISWIATENTTNLTMKAAIRQHIWHPCARSGSNKEILTTHLRPIFRRIACILLLTFYQIRFVLSYRSVSSSSLLTPNIPYQQLGGPSLGYYSVIWIRSSNYMPTNCCTCNALKIICWEGDALSKDLLCTWKGSPH